MSLLGWNFFALSSEFKQQLLDEIYYLVKFGNFSYSDLMSMPVYERKFFMNKLYKEYEKKDE
jgi:hypothetical protein